jgi:tetratricopeptide (TPR) repeat protein
MVDDAVARGTDAAVKFVQKHFNVVQWIIVLGLAVWIGWEIHSWRRSNAEERSTDALIEAVRAEQAKLGSPEDEGKPDIRGGADARRVLPSPEARVAAAEKGYRAAATTRPGAPVETLSELGLAGVLYDGGKHADAQKLYEKVLASDLARKDPDVRGRALEGIALCLEAAGKVDDAFKRYKELENADLGTAFTAAARFSQARILHTQGKTPEAKELLQKVVEATKPEPGEPPGYIGQAARDLLESIDPGAAQGTVAQDAVEKALEQLKSVIPPAPATP